MMAYSIIPLNMLKMHKTMDLEKCLLVKNDSPGSHNNSNGQFSHEAFITKMSAHLENTFYDRSDWEQQESIKNIWEFLELAADDSFNSSIEIWEFVFVAFLQRH